MALADGKMGSGRYKGKRKEYNITFINIIIWVIYFTFHYSYLIVNKSLLKIRYLIYYNIENQVNHSPYSYSEVVVAIFLIDNYNSYTLHNGLQDK